MNDSRSDAELVTAYLGGAPDALAAIYDRYADPLYDTAAVMLRDRHEAADLTQDVFLVAAERLGQLRDRSRLKPWLFAILRNEVYRQTKRRGRSVPVHFGPVDSSAPDTRGAVVDVPAALDPAAEAGRVAYQQLAADIRTAASGLDERDQLVLELTARHGLSGEDLADALGVSLDQSYVVVHRMRERAERSLGALVVARTGRRDCAELATILRDWDGEFGVLVRKRVARHVERCSVCAETRRRLAAVPLVALAPAMAAPRELRDSVLRAVGHRQPSRLRRDEFSDPSGFPRPVAQQRRGLPVLTTAASVVLVLAASVAVLLMRSSPSIDAEIALDSTVATVAAMPGSTALDVATPSAETATTGEVAATMQPAIVTIPPPTVTAAPPPTPGTTAPPSTTTNPPPPTNPGQFVIVTAADTQPPQVEITQDRPTVACPWSAPIVIAASVTDVSAVDAVTLSWSGPGDPGSNPMSRSGNSWSARLELEQTGGTWNYVVTATDAAGNTGTAHGATDVVGC